MSELLHRLVHRRPEDMPLATSYRLMGCLFLGLAVADVTRLDQRGIFDAAATGCMAVLLFTLPRLGRHAYRAGWFAARAVTLESLREGQRRGMDTELWWRLERERDLGDLSRGIENP